MKYSIDKYLLLEAAQDVAALKSAHKTADHPQPEDNSLLTSLKNAIKNKTNYLQD